MIKGGDILITEDDGTAIVALSRAFEIDVDCEDIEVTPENVSRYRDYIAGLIDWNLGITHFVSDLSDDALKVGNKYELYSYDKRDQSITLIGIALCKKVHVTDSKGALTKGTFTFKGCGPLFATP